jgi:hypothetical protein
MIDPRGMPEVEGAVVFDDCDAAIIGYGGQHGMEPVLVYDYNLLVQIFIEDGLTEEESIEHVDYNIACLWAGERTPVIMFRFLEES